MAREDIPTSRLGRSATIGRLAAETAAKRLATRAANVARGEEASQEALARRHVDTAEQIVAVLGTMKGAAMKLGQVMSFLDVGLRRRGVPRGVSAQARRAARQRSKGLVRGDAQGDRD
jgi:hypothetical protein